MKTGKKVLSLLLAVCMIFAMVPMMASAATNYKVTVPEGITADKTQAAEGATVTLTVDKGYVFADNVTGPKVASTSDKITDPVEVTKIPTNADQLLTFVFKMPKFDVKVTADFKELGFKLPKGITAKAVDADADPITLGNVIFGAAPGDEVALTVDDGYELARNGLKLTAKDGDKTTTVEFKGKGDYYIFTMPDNGVTVTATFKKVANPNAAITSFIVKGVKGEINEAKKTITLTVRNGVNLTGLVPEIKASDKATVKIYGGLGQDNKEIWTEVKKDTKVDFDTPQVFKVVAQDTTEVKYTVTATYKIGPVDTGVDKVLETVTHNKYMSGYENGTFGANDSITRAEVVAMFYNLLKDKSIGKDDKIVEFTDIPAYAWYKTALDKLSSMKVVTGYSDGSFGPNTNITRAEFAAITAKFISKDVSGTVKFPDVSTDAWYLKALQSTMGAGWWTGDTAGNFNPTKNITRAEAVSVVNKMLDREPDKEFIDEKTNAKDIASFTDLDNKHWAYYAIIEAATSHKYAPTLGGEEWD